MSNGEEPVSSNIDTYVSPWTGKRGPEAYYEDVGAGRLPPFPGQDVEGMDALINRVLEDALNNLTTETTTTGRTRGRDVSITEQVSRRFVGVPTEEQFLNNFENAFVGFTQGMLERGASPADVNLARSGASGLMDMLMDEYMGELSQRAARGEDIFELVGTEGVYELLRTEPGTESRTIGTGERVSEQETVSTQISPTTQESAEAEPAPTSTSTSRFEDVETRESTFKEVTEVLSLPEISAVFKFSPTQYLTQRFGDNPEQLAVFLRGRKGERTRQAQTAVGGEVVSARRV